MAIRNIVKEGDERLAKVCRPVEKFDRHLEELVHDMKDTLKLAEGLGLAAPQVGILRRVVVMDCGDGLIEAINPVIISASGEQGDLEGCLSFPGKSGYVVRPNHVVMRAYDRDGSLIEYEAEGLLARCIMHECDHLDGILYPMRMLDLDLFGFSDAFDEDDDPED